VEASALTESARSGARTHGRSPLLRLQSDERLIALVRRGNQAAFEVLVSRYQARLLSFCRHMLGSREDAEDVLQEVFAAAYNAMLADDRPINARPWLYRIARNRSLNHLRRVQPIGVDSMDVHLSEHGTTTADKVDKREQFRELIADVQQLPETQRTALLLREIDALSYEQIAEAMETTIPSVKSLLVRARVSLAEAAAARQLSCEDVRIELGEIAEGLRRRTSPPVRRHLRECERCTVFRTELRATSKALALLLPVGPLLLARRLFFAHLGLSSMAGASGAGSAASGTAAAGAGASAVAGAASVSGGGLVSAGIGAISSKAAAGIAAAALVTAGAVEIERHAPPSAQPQVVAQQATPATAAAPAAPAQPNGGAAAPTAAARAPEPRPAADARDEREEPAATTTTETTPAPPPTTTTTTAEPIAAVPGHTHVETGATTLPATLPSTPPPTLLPAPSAAAGTPAATTPPPAATTPVPPPSTTPTPPPGTTTPEPPGSTTPEPPPGTATPEPPPTTTPPPATTTTPAPPVEPAP
jgi:RNA polymerase sigma factor (sigma-70 family)